MTDQRLVAAVSAFAAAVAECDASPAVREAVRRAEQAVAAGDHAEPPAERVFVSLAGGGVYDVATEAPSCLEVYVIDETGLDDQGRAATIESQDGTDYTARVKRLAPTAPHFDVAQVVAAAGSRTFANGSLLEDEPSTSLGM